MPDDTRTGNWYVCTLKNVPVPIIVGGFAAIGALVGVGVGLMFRKPRSDLRGTAPARRNLAQHYDNPDYEFYVVNPEGFIESGWDYIEDARDQIKDNLPPGRWRVIARRGMSRLHVDPKDDASWLTAYAA